MREKTIKGTYGRGTPCRVFVCGDWYAVEGSKYANRAACSSSLVNGVDVETVQDVDSFTGSEMDSLSDLVSEVDDFIYG